MKTLTIGVASYKKIKEITMAVARGKLKITKNDPKIWFSSIESLAQVLSTKNKMLLEIISKQEPKNIKELAMLSGRQKSNLSRTLKTLQQYGLVELKMGHVRELITVIPYGKLKVNCELLQKKVGGAHPTPKSDLLLERHTHIHSMYHYFLLPQK